MGKTFAEKALARASGQAETSAGEFVDVYPDLCMTHVFSALCIRSLDKLGNPKLYDPNRLAFVMDHVSPASSVRFAADQKLARDFAAHMGIRTFYDVDAGIAHQVLIENGHVLPGYTVIGTDSHSTIYGAVGALGTGVGITEMTATWVTGKLWMKVPDSIRVDIEGPLAPGCSAKDVMLKLIGDLTADGATYHSVEFHGSFVAASSIAARLTLCNLAMEMGAKCAYVPPDAVTEAYFRARGVGPERYEALYPDPDCHYVRTVTIEGASLVPQVACPHRVDHVKPVTAVAGTRVDQVHIGSCANASFEDLQVAAQFLQGRRVAPGVRLLVTPSSKQTVAECLKSGVYETLLAAGAVITNPGCGACAGDGGLLAPGEVCLSTSNRNFQGRMGSYDAEIYLASPATAAVTAITGVITDPRTGG